MLKILRAVLFEIVGWYLFFFFCLMQKGDETENSSSGVGVFYFFYFIITETTSYDKMVLGFRIGCRNQISDL